MRILAALIVIGPLMLIGPPPAAAGGGSALPLGSGAPVRLAVGDEATADRDTYVREAQDKTQEWQRKLHELGDKAETDGKDARDVAVTDLNSAWARTEAASHRLQTVSAEEWESAKASYEEASHDLAAAWHKVHPETE